MHIFYFKFCQFYKKCLFLKPVEFSEIINYLSFQSVILLQERNGAVYLLHFTKQIKRRSIIRFNRSVWI